ncbi:hypothetical protein F5X68DRAFT_201382 [Plectosphaerella plurivora]|uniref:Abscission/NoCut checkpoint regulator n=1 Tax=Plectosphaerella plurivora TaxID=936078 RepID=A0A9P8VJ69_9PEZI|nr:hypothetical protein F5X68DRAFT_201382 [Plectosphaerella plurivora]
MSANNKDQSLLDRLNALKGGNDAGISLDRSSNALNVSIGVEKAKPPSKEDALAARLRSLRNTPDRETAPAASPSRNISTPSGLAGTVPAAGAEEHLFDTDDKTLEELLGPGDDYSQGPPSWAAPAKVDEGRAEALLEELSRGITPSDIKPIGHRTTENPDDEQPPNPDEDSDGEHMSRDVRTLLSKALDEAELEAKLNPPTEPQPEASNPSSPGATDDPLSLPSVPSAIGSSDDTGLSLPSVPITVGARSSADLETDLEARMAALSLPSSSGDPDIGLPSVPMDQPANRLRTRTGYTDADQEKWCTVCLEDATLRCLGCDDDVYCTRCWREMHLGPAAAFDDRTHKAVLFGKDPRKKEKKTMVGA